VLGDLHPLGDSPRRSLADSGARVAKVLPTAELEGLLTGLIVAMPLEPVGGAAVGDDVEEAQELAVEAPAGGDYAGQEGVFENGVAGPVAVHLGASGALEDPTVCHGGMETGISEASKRVSIFSFATLGGKQVSFHFREWNRVQAREAQIRFPAG